MSSLLFGLMFNCFISGKTSLLYALLGEMMLTGRKEGSTEAAIERKGSVSYVSQTPFIVNATV